jgi:xylulose-5-phosphate/fructose-6-phosphate phosphoketolase
VLEVTNRAWVAETLPWDDHLASDGRVMEMLSEHVRGGAIVGHGAAAFCGCVAE